MKKLLFSVALIVILLSFQASAIRTKKSQPLNSKPFLNDALKSSRKSPSHKLQTANAPILVETSSGVKSQKDAETDSEVIAGNSEYTHYNDGRGNAIFNYTASLMSESGETLNDASMFFSFNRNNGHVQLNISALDTIDISEEDGVSEGCQGYWNAKTNQIVQDEAHPFQNNCFIYNPNSFDAISFQSFKNVQNVIAKSASEFTWVCNAEGDFYIFSIASCAWVPTASNPVKNPNNAIFFLEKSHSN